MAESTLSVVRDDVRSEAAWELGFGRSSSGWSTAQITTLDAVEKATYRLATYPPGGHAWKFLEPIASLSTWRTITGTISTATYDSSTGLTTLTATASVFNSSVPGRSLVDDTSSNSYVVDGYTSATVVTLVGDASSETGTFTLTAGDAYRAPDDFDSLVNRMMFSSSGSESYQPIEQRTIEYIYDRRRAEGRSGIPKYVGFNPVTNLAGQQRWDMVFFPEPSQAYTLNYRYRITPDNLTASATSFYGGTWFGELLLAAARSAAEFEVTREHGGRHQDFMEKLATCILRDRNTQPQTVGYMGDPSTGTEHVYDRNSRTVTLDY